MTVAVLSHPGPLPLGEGGSFAAARENLRLGWRDVQPNFRERRWLLPSRSGRGIEGEGECAQTSSGDHQFQKTMPKDNRNKTNL